MLPHTTTRRTCKRRMSSPLDINPGLTDLKKEINDLKQNEIPEIKNSITQLRTTIYVAGGLCATLAVPFLTALWFYSVTPIAEIKNNQDELVRLTSELKGAYLSVEKSQASVRESVRDLSRTVSTLQNGAMEDFKVLVAVSQPLLQEDVFLDEEVYLTVDSEGSPEKSTVKKKVSEGYWYRNLYAIVPSIWEPHVFLVTLKLEGQDDINPVLDAIELLGGTAVRVDNEELGISARFDDRYTYRLDVWGDAIELKLSRLSPNCSSLYNIDSPSHELDYLASRMDIIVDFSPSPDCVEPVAVSIMHRDRSHSGILFSKMHSMPSPTGEITILRESN